MFGFVKCPATITSPAPDPAFKELTGLGPNEPCPAWCEVVTPAPAMEFTCPLGHHFVASEKDIRQTKEGE